MSKYDKSTHVYSKFKVRVLASPLTIVTLTSPLTVRTLLVEMPNYDIGTYVPTIAFIQSESFVISTSSSRALLVEMPKLH
jgi:hypothetical protein